MTHLTMEQLLATREPGLEPGVQKWRDHLDACPACQAESDRLGQRVARLKALPTLRPARDRFTVLRSQVARQRRGRRLRRIAVAGLALAASATLAIVSANQPKPERTLVAADAELADIMSRSRRLEQVLSGFDPDRRVVDGRAVAVTSSIEDELARIDRRIEAVGLRRQRTERSQMLSLWRERVGLLDALVDVHLTGARYVGF